MKSKSIILLVLVFITINTAIYISTKLKSDDKINMVLDNKIQSLSTHYQILLETQKTVAIRLYKSTIQEDKVIKIISKANNASKEKKAQLREELQELLKYKYKLSKEQGILQYHFVLPNNESFYRAHKPNKFGDDLTNIRADYKYTNETKEPIRGFAQGRTSHAFRNTFPIFDKNNKHIGAMEVSFSSDSFQWYLNKISNIHSHFIVDKNIFTKKTWKKKNLVLKYIESFESKDYMLTLNKRYKKGVCIYENASKSPLIQKQINTNIKLNKEFALYIDYDNHIDVASFLPIKNINNKIVAWIVAYEHANIIEQELSIILTVRIIGLFISLLIIYFLINQISSKQKLKKSNDSMKQQHQLLDDILNLTDNIMIVTDFKTIKFSNDKFKDFINVSCNDISSKSQYINLLDMFINANGYLHAGLLKDNENFISLVARTNSSSRVVSLLDNKLEVKAFTISIVKAHLDDDYVVTLTDITKMREEQIEIKRKAYIDNLTQVYNRNKFNEIFEDEIIRIKRYKHPLTIAIIDIDKFKNFNDTFGHLVGDEVLVMMAQTVNNSVRDTDTFARWGGEEFVILFKETTILDAKKVSINIKDKIQECNHKTAGGITASFGLTEYIDGDTIETIFKRCDDALYLAKKNGRNRIEIF